ncbi:alpha-amylase family glycosyl hydrolase [Streptosporangium canum]|uniref:alpha-amylase family glycosyl hydrolase n=1 Tax=Streptosporangium canum TaxID=324952 RepID=UPI003693FCB4
MTGRLRRADHAHEVARRIRRVLAAESPDGLLVAEHAHDATGDLDADGWQGTMNYAGFTRPAWSWLRGPEVRLPFLGVPAEVPRIGGGDAVATMRAFSSLVSWRALTHSWSILGSHDTARIRTVCGGDPALVEVAAGLMFTLPGTPMVFAGDEIGLEGAWGEDSRRTMPWDRPERWDHGTFGVYRDLVALRRSEPACATAACAGCTSRRTPWSMSGSTRASACWCWPPAPPTARYGSRSPPVRLSPCTAERRRPFRPTAPSRCRPTGRPSTSGG